MTNTAAPRHPSEASHAAAGALLEARRRTDQAQQIERQLIGLAALALRHHGLTDDSIARQLGVRAATLTEHIRCVRLIQHPDDQALREQLEELWLTARRAASDWIQTDSITTSRDVIYANDIPVDFPLPIHTLDTPGTEFVHQQSGEKIVIYSPYWWKGTPTVALGQILDWDHKGCYHIEFISAAGERGTITPTALGLPAGAEQFHTGTARTRDAHEQAHTRITTAIRRAHGILPPYLETAALRLISTPQ